MLAIKNLFGRQVSPSDQNRDMKSIQKVTLNKSLVSSNGISEIKHIKKNGMYFLLSCEDELVFLDSTTHELYNMHNQIDADYFSQMSWVCPLDKSSVDDLPYMVIVANSTELCHYDLYNGVVAKSAKYALESFSIVSRVSGTSYFIV